MRNPQYYFINCFNSRNISLDEIFAFGTDCLQRLISRNGSGEWTAHISAIAPRIDALDSAFTADLTQLGTRKACKMAMRGFREILPDEVEKITNFVVAHFGKDSPQMTKCLPQGMEAIRKGTDDSVENHLATLVAGVQAVVATVGNDKLAQAQALLAAWQPIHEESESSTAGKALTEAEQRAARRALQRELFLTLLDLAKKHIDEPEMLGLYMQPHLAGGPPLGGTPPGPDDEDDDGDGGGVGTSSSSAGSPSSSSSSSPPPPLPSSSSSSPSSSSSSSSPPPPPPPPSSSSSSSSSSGPPPP